MQVGGVAQLLGDENDARGDRGEVTARPGLLLALLDRGEVGLGRFQRVCHVGLPRVVARCFVRA